MSEPRQKKIPPPGKCRVCGRRCEPWQRNIDATYACDDCLRGHAASPSLIKKEAA